METMESKAIVLAGYNPQSIGAYSHLGEAYLEIKFASEEDAERFYEDVKLIGYEVPKDIDLKVDDQDASLGLTTVQIMVGAMQELTPNALP
jgi:hypothetical protein